MKIGIVTQCFATNSGIGNNAYYTSQELENLGHDVSVITSNVPSGNNDRGMRVIRIGQDLKVLSNGTFGNLTVGYKLSEKLGRVFSQEKFDIVHIHSPLEPILPILSLREAPHPVVGTFHTYMENSVLHDLASPYLKKYMKRLDGRLAVSQPAADFYGQYFPYQYKIIPNGVDCQRFSPKIKPINKFDDSTFTILFIGRIDPRKGLRYLFEAFSIVYGHRKKVRLVVVGSGVMAEYYKRYLLPELVDQVFFEGFVSDQDLPRYLAAADVYVSPATRGESFGLVLLEAMASGKPVVASSITGYKSVMSKKEGIFVPPKSPVALAKAIINLMDNPGRRKELGKAGRIKAKTYDWTKVAKMLEEFFQDVQDVIKKKRQAGHIR